MRTAISDSRDVFRVGLWVTLVEFLVLLVFGAAVLAAAWNTLMGV